MYTAPKVLRAMARKKSVLHNLQALLMNEFMNVEVPDGVFAKEPPEWEKAWVNWLFRNKAIDQCDYRRRRIFAYFPLLQPLIFTTICAVRLFITLICWSILMRGVNIKPVIHPLQNSTLDIIEGCQWALGPGEPENVWKLLFLPFMPIWGLIITALTLVTAVPLWEAVKVHLIIFGVLYALVTLLVLLVTICHIFVVMKNKLKSLVSKSKPKSKESRLTGWLKKRQAKKTWYQNDYQTQLLVCAPERKVIRSYKRLAKKPSHSSVALSRL